MIVVEKTWLWMRLDLSIRHTNSRLFRLKGSAQKHKSLTQISRTPHELVTGSSNNGTHMLSRMPDKSRAIVLCENYPPPDDELEMYSRSSKRSYSTFP